MIFCNDCDKTNNNTNYTHKNVTYSVDEYNFYKVKPIPKIYVNKYDNFEVKASRLWYGLKNKKLTVVN